MTLRTIYDTTVGATRRVIPQVGVSAWKQVKDGTWVTLYYQDMGYSWSPRALQFRPRVDAGFSRQSVQGH